MSSQKLFVVKNYSFSIESEKELLDCFSYKDLKRVVAPLKIKYPVTSQFYYSWTESSGVYMYLVFKQPHWSQPKGFVFNRKQTGSDINNSRMCDWCHYYGPADQVGLVTLKSSSKETLGLFLCLDLSCMEKTETISYLAGKNFEKQSQKLCEKMGEFLDYVLNKKTLT